MGGLGVAIWSDYRWAVNFNVALGSLTNVEDDLATYTNGQSIHPTNPPINHLPIRKTALDGVERGSGKIPHVWNFGLPLAAIQYIQTTYFIVSSVQVATRDMTIYTLDHEANAFKRWNARLYRPVPGQDYTYDVVSQMSEDFKIRMLLVEQLA
jgi:hypothetical protein